MARQTKTNKIGQRTRPTALILVEGDTEFEFYSTFVTKYCPFYPKKFKNLEGSHSINRKIVDSAVSFSYSRPREPFMVFLCLDQERPNQPVFNESACYDKIHEKCTGFRGFFPVIANLMCESLFFLDIDGIYKYLKAPLNKRKPKAFSNFRSLTHRDLSNLFKQFDREYVKGKRCEELVSALDLDLIRAAEEINSFAEKLT